MKPDPARLELAAYPHHVELHPRFADVDTQLHLNNVRVVELYQEARTSFNRAAWEEAKLGGPIRRFYVARQCVDYLAEAQWPGAVIIGVGVTRIGNSSYSLGLAMFQNEQCVGVSDVVLVFATDKGPTPIPDAIRELLATKLLPSRPPTSMNDE